MEKPWENEPDELHGEFCGLKWRIKRNNPGMGSLCGYVKLPLGHELYGLNYDDTKLPDTEVHGGLTYAGIDPEDNQMEYGFDCTHYRDLVPGMVKIIPDYLEKHSDETYKDMKFVKRECQKLAWQLAGNTFTSKLSKALFERYAKDE